MPSRSTVRPFLLVAAVALAGLAVGGFAIFSPDIPFVQLEAKYANRESRFMDLPGGVRVHYRDQGAQGGPPIVMVHGFSASLHAWEPWVSRLGDRYRIVTLDLPGHGLTRAPSNYAPTLGHYADVVEAVTRRLGLRSFVLVGNSMGGGVAWRLTLDHPDEVRALVLIDSIGLPAPGPSRRTPLIFRLLANPVGRALLRNIDAREFAARGLKDAYVDPALVTSALIDRYVDLSRAPGHRAILLNGSGGAGPPETARTFQAIAVPTLVMHGAADTVIPVAAGRSLAAAIPGARLIVYPGVGHVPMEQIPDRSAADLRTFLASLPEDLRPRPPTG